MAAQAARSNGHDHGPHLGFIHIDGQSLVTDINAVSHTMVRVETTVNHTQAQVTGIDTRLRQLEVKVWAIPSGAIVLGVVALVISIWGQIRGLGMPKFKDWSGPARKRLYRALPLIGSALAVFGVMNESKAAVVVGIIGLLMGPASGEVAARHVPDED